MNLAYAFVFTRFRGLQDRRYRKDLQPRKLISCTGSSGKLRELQPGGTNGGKRTGESQTDPRERSLPDTQEPRLKLRPLDQRAAPEATKCPRSERPDHTEVATAGEGGRKTRGSAARIGSSEGTDPRSLAQGVSRISQSAALTCRSRLPRSMSAALGRQPP